MQWVFALLSDFVYTLCFIKNKSQACRRFASCSKVSRFGTLWPKYFELRDVLGRKAPQALADVEVFLAELAFDLVPTPVYSQKLISDPKDQPILNAAIIAGVDIIISGDKHFLKLDMERPRTMTAAQYLELIEIDE